MVSDASLPARPPMLPFDETAFKLVLTSRGSSNALVFERGAVYYILHVEIFFFVGDLSDQKKTKKKRNGCPQLNSRYSQKSRHNTEEDAPRSLSHSQKEYARTKERQKRAFGIGDRWCFCCFCWWW